jgi:hypothetical protein
MKIVEIPESDLKHILDGAYEHMEQARRVLREDGEDDEWRAFLFAWTHFIDTLEGDANGSE